MNKIPRSLAVLVTAVSATAATYNGDLFLGFTTQSGKDLIYDIGPASSLFPGQTFSLSSSLLGAGINSLGSVKWGVIGDRNVGGQRFAWTTSGGAVPNTIPNTAVWGSIDTPARSIASQFTTLSLNRSATPDSSFDNSWNQQTIAGTLTTQYHNAYGDPNVSGLKTASFYRVLADGSAPELVGTFNLAANGTVTFVPEPGTYALFGLGVLSLLFQRKFIRNR
jgi:hypothetical protein